MWKTGQEYKLRERKGRYIQAAFFWDRTKWLSTGTDNYAEAERWARNYIIKMGHGECLNGKPVTFGEFAEGFYNDGGKNGFIERRKEFDRAYSPKQQEDMQRVLNVYIMPYFKNVELSKITVRMIEDWLINGIKPQYNITKNEISSSYKSKMLYCLRLILNEAVRIGTLDKNPCDYVTAIKVRTRFRKEALSEDDIRRMLPDNLDELVDIWGDVQYALYFSLLADTGFRPGEVLAISNKEYYPDLHGIYTTSSVDTHTGRLKDKVKTSDKGYFYRIGYVSDRSVMLINALPWKNRTGFFFGSSEKSFITYGCLRSKLTTVARRLKVSVQNPTPYYFRHTFMTRATTKLAENDLLKLMGHTSYRKEYDHASPEARLAQLADKRNMIVGG